MLIPCPACKKEISDKSPNCIHCGVSLSNGPVPLDSSPGETSDVAANAAGVSHDTTAKAEAEIVQYRRWREAGGETPWWQYRHVEGIGMKIVKAIWGTIVIFWVIGIEIGLTTNLQGAKSAVQASQLYNEATTTLLTIIAITLAIYLWGDAVK